MAVCLITQQNDSSVIDLTLLIFFWGTGFLRRPIGNGVECFEWLSPWPDTTTCHSTPFSCPLAYSHATYSEDGKMRIATHFWWLCRHGGGVVIRKREDGISLNSNEVPRHAHGKWFTGARPESEPVASNRVGRTGWAFVGWPLA